MKNYKSLDPINISSNNKYSVKQIAIMIKKIIKFDGKLVFDTSKPDGAKIKILDNTPLTNLGWKTKTNFEDCLSFTYEWYKNQL